MRYCEDSNFATFHKRLSKKRGSFKATISAASKLLRIMFSMLKRVRDMKEIIRVGTFTVMNGLRSINLVL